MLTNIRGVISRRVHKIRSHEADKGLILRDQADGKSLVEALESLEVTPTEVEARQIEKGSVMLIKKIVPCFFSKFPCLAAE